MTKLRKVSTFKRCLSSILLLLAAVAFLPLAGCKTGSGEFQTAVSIAGDKWYFNGQIINPGSTAEGLLMNVRMVNTVFEDRSGEIDKLVPGFDPDENTDNFISRIPEYVGSGVNAFTICLQGGLPGYEGAINTAFNSDGTIRDDYMNRVDRVIRACDENSAVVILSLFYQRQHSHHSALTGRESIMNATRNTVEWLRDKGYTNVVLEIANEYRHGGYRNWQDGEWLMSEEGQVELIELAKSVYPELLVSTSGMGNGRFHELLAGASDFLLIHFNDTPIDDIPSRIGDVKKYGKPIVCNEDDKYEKEGAASQALSVLNGCSWGYMGMPVNQWIPFEFKGVEDDPEVYRMYRNLTTPGSVIDPEALKQTSITITHPNDGQIFPDGRIIIVSISYLYPDTSAEYSIELLVNGEKAANARTRVPIRVNWTPEGPGIYIFQAVVRDEAGNELQRSGQVDIIVQD